MILRIYDKLDNITTHNVTDPIEIKYTEELSALPTIEFSISGYDDVASEIDTEGYIRCEYGKFVIKEKNIDDDYTVNVYAIYDVPELKAKSIHSWKHTFSVSSAINDAISGTGWTAAYNSGLPSGTVEMDESDISVFELVQDIKSNYNVELSFDNVNKVINVYPSGGIGTNRGSYAIDDLNVNEFSMTRDTNELATKLIAYGKDGISCTVTNNDYCDKVITKIWSDDRYTTVATLRNAAQKALDKIAKPNVSYSLTMANLDELTNGALTVSKVYLGDTIYIASHGVATKQRIVKLVRDLKNPYETQMELENAVKNLAVSNVDRGRQISELQSAIATRSGGGSASAIDSDTINDICT